MLLLAGLARAQEVALVRPDDCFGSAATCVVEVAVADRGSPRVGAHVDVTATPPRGGAGAPVTRPLGEVAPGRYRFEVPRDATLAASVDGGPARPLGALDLLARAPRTVTDVTVADAVVGAPVTFPFPASPGLAPDRLEVATSEGRVTDLRVEGERLVVVVTPGPDRSARVLQVGVLDLTNPGAEPAWGVASLRARQTADVTIGAGSRATVAIGRRTYGPFAADSSGAARLSFDVLPGETTASIEATDDLGNTRTVRTPLPTPTAPVLTTLLWPLAADAGAGMWVRVVTPDGRLRTDADPTCFGPDGPVPLSPDRSGAWVATWLRSASPTAPPDVSVECALELGTARARLALGAGQPARINLRVYPDTLASDFPLAQLQATLLDARGDRLPTTSLSLHAERGTLATRAEDGVIRADYRGDAAIAAGGDHLEARWYAPAGSGGAWGLAAFGSVADGALVVRARVTDRAGNPLVGVPVAVSDGVSAVDVPSDDRGWAEARLPPPPEGLVIVAVRAGLLRRDVPVYTAAPVALPDRGRPDLVRAVELPIRAGRVRRIFLDVSPRPLVVGVGQSARVAVQLLDAAGNQVVGEAVALSAEPGTVSGVRPRPDGTIEATYTPPSRTSATSARITASVGDTSVATELELVARPVRGAVGLDLGWVTNFGAISSPVVTVAATTHLPGMPSVVAVRGGIGTWGVLANVRDEATGEDIGVRAQFFGADLGPAVVERRARRVLEAGVSLAVIPYSLTVSYGDERGIAGNALVAPGVLLHAGAGYRLGSSELFGEARYLFAAGEEGPVTFVGGVGGVSITGGYRVLF